MPNHLKTETSPYLQQHADNPVNWYPWNETTLAIAKAENKPILLSIGYSACHWCHVMARESFSDVATAELMNKWFINIKVDKEERPDLDKIYQLAYQMLMQRPGGWPLTVFLTPADQVPYLAGTYFPPVPRYQLPSFKQVLQYANEVYTYQKNKINEQNQALINAFQKMATMAPAANTLLTDGPIKVALKVLAVAADKVNGGFGDAPKFPHPTQLELLLYLAQQGDSQAKEIVEFTLTKMAQSGVYDQLQGGFFRYAVDAQWLIPHFEKMLYDNAQLIDVYTQAYVLTQNNLYKNIVIETIAWLKQIMQAPNGGYYATLNAESEDEEGKYYAWTQVELETLLDSAEYAVISKHFGINQRPNFADKWHLHVVEPLTEAEQTIFKQAKNKLLAARAQRIFPSRDEKILTSWNGLVIKALAKAGKAFARKDFVTAAEKALQFIKTQLWRNKRLFASYKNDQARFQGYLADYVYLVDGILTLQQCRPNQKELQFACELVDVVLEHFADHKNGGFYFTADEHEQLIYRPKNLADEAMPADNGIAAKILLELYKLTRNQKYIIAVEQTLKFAWVNIEHDPDMHSALLLALADYLNIQ